MLTDMSIWIGRYRYVNWQIWVYLLIGMSIFIDMYGLLCFFEWQGNW